MFKNPTSILSLLRYVFIKWEVLLGNTLSSAFEDSWLTHTHLPGLPSGRVEPHPGFGPENPGLFLLALLGPTAIWLPVMQWEYEFQSYICGCYIMFLVQQEEGERKHQWAQETVNSLIVPSTWADQSGQPDSDSGAMFLLEVPSKGWSRV